MKKEIKKVLIDNYSGCGLNIDQATEDLYNLFSNSSSTIPYDSLSTSFKESIQQIEENLEKNSAANFTIVPDNINGVSDNFKKWVAATREEGLNITQQD